MAVIVKLTLATYVSFDLWDYTISILEYNCSTLLCDRSTCGSTPGGRKEVAVLALLIVNCSADHNTSCPGVHAQCPNRDSATLEFTTMLSIMCER